MYRKNTASQFVCFQLILTATGAVATGLSPTYRRCIDGTFAAGGGTITEDSAGFYKCALAQADTNGNDISYCFTATGAIPVVVNIVTTAADPTDGVRLGLTGLANAVPGAAGGLFIAGTNAATTVTTSFTTTFTGNLTGSVGSVTGAVGSVTGAVASVTGNVGGNVTGSVGSVVGAVGSVTGNVGGNVTGSVGSVATGGIAAASFAAGAIDAAALATDAVTEIADGILARDLGSGSNAGSAQERTVRAALRFNRNKVSISGGTMTVTTENDSTTAWTAAITTDAAADPVTAIDPT